MSQHKIYIFTQPVHSGKTTTLQKWLRNKDIDIGGILTPDVEGLRRIYDIAEGKYHDFQVDGEVKEDDTLFMGKYRFAKDAFRKGREILQKAVDAGHEWVIVDEVGKLEVDENQGFEPILSQIVEQYKAGAKGKLILVVRDYLLGDAIEKYSLNRDMILHNAFFK
jgi:nucleoside-triphosphatase THEP1